MHIIIIGAGASGLVAAKQLAEAGKEVTVLEARERIGGRIHTFNNNGQVMEGGAEFIHGNLPVTLQLLKEAALTYTEVQGGMYECYDGEWKVATEAFEDAELLIEKLEQLQDNISIQEFLDREFAGDEYYTLRMSVLGYIQGYYAADPSRCSALEFYEEFTAEDEQQYRIDEGYGKLLQYLEQSITSRTGKIELSAILKEIHWQQGHVVVHCTNGQTYKGDKVIITIPIGLWQKQTIKLVPALPAKHQAALQLGYGSVIKILLQFKEPFWKNEGTHDQLKQNLSNLGFIFSAEDIPTYWTQQPASSSLLTGWIGGPPADELSKLEEEAIISKTIDSLASIFMIDADTLHNWLEWAKVFNWPADPFTLGGYSYTTTTTAVARKRMKQTVENTLYFAGEGLYTGTEMGTVEAALTSGIETAEEILGL